MLRLYTRWRNSAGERVRIALNLKAIPYQYVVVDSLPPGAYARLNPQGLMPALEVDGQIIAQSSAILSYLEEAHPEPSLLPADPVDRARARSFGALIASEMHSLTVNRVRKYLGGPLERSDEQVAAWVDHWLTLGFAALEATLRERAVASPFCFGDEPGWADLHLVPQLSNARRLGVPLDLYPTLLQVEARCLEIEAFQQARPEAQPDFPG